MQSWHGCRWFAVSLLCAAVAGPALAAPDGPSGLPAPGAVLHLSKGFIDDPLELSADGDRVYYVATDGATFAELRAAEVPAPVAGASRGEFKILGSVPGLPIAATQILLLPEERVLVMTREAGTESQAPGPVTGTAYGFKGQPPRRVGPASEMVLSTVAGAPALVLFSRPPNQQGLPAQTGEVRIQALHAGTLKPLLQRSYRLKDGALMTTQGPVLPLYYLDDHLTLVARQPGEYDRKTDLRQPDRFVVLDLLSGKVQRGPSIADPATLVETTRLHEKHPGESLFATYNPEFTQVFIQSSQASQPEKDLRREAKLPRKLSLYDPDSLRTQPAPGVLFLSLTVDPVNAAAVARKKADKDLIDLCEFDLKSGETRRLIELPGNKRPSRWVVGPSGRLALLRKHTGFSRGGSDLEFYDLKMTDVPQRAASEAH